MMEQGLDEKTRAEDILLGPLGYGEDAHIIWVERSGRGYCGAGRFSDGEEFEFASAEELSELELWALEVLARLRVMKRHAPDSAD
jgi:hypothetical protein